MRSDQYARPRAHHGVREEPVTLTVHEQLEAIVEKALEHDRAAREERVKVKVQRRATHHAQRHQAVPAAPKPRCGARRKYDGQPCQAMALPRGRCKLHGGLSTGPRTEAGRARALANLKIWAQRGTAKRHP